MTPSPGSLEFSTAASCWSCLPPSRDSRARGLGHSGEQGFHPPSGLAAALPLSLKKDHPSGLFLMRRALEFPGAAPQNTPTWAHRLSRNVPFPALRLNAATQSGVGHVLQAEEAPQLSSGIPGTGAPWCHWLMHVSLQAHCHLLPVYLQGTCTSVSKCPLLTGTPARLIRTPP